MRYALFYYTVLLALLLPASALAQTAEPPEPQADAIMYMSAGVGEDHTSPTPQGPEPWTLKMIFAEKQSRSYVSDVDVLIKDANGKQLVEAFSDGPWFLVALPKGTYEVQTSYEGATDTKKIAITERKMRTVYFLF